MLCEKTSQECSYSKKINHLIGLLQPNTIKCLPHLILSNDGSYICADEFIG